MPLFFLGTREWRNRQTRTVQVRVPVMEWGFNSPLAHDETADPTGSAVFVVPGCCLRPAGVPGALHTRGAGLRRGRRPAREPSALRAFGSARRLESRPGPATAHGHRSQAPPPPTGTAADPFGALHTSGAGALMYGSVRRLEARPGPAAAHGHRGRSLRRPPHRRRCVAGVWLGASSQSPARPRASKRSLSSVSHAIP